MNSKCNAYPRTVIVTSLRSDEAAVYPFKEGDLLLSLGEIKNMPGHCVVVDRNGNVLWGYHTENFREPTEDER